MLETQALLFEAFKNSSTNVTGEGKANITGGDNRDPKSIKTLMFVSHKKTLYIVMSQKAR